MSNYSDEALDRACEAVGAVDTSKEFEFPVELQDAFWLCAQGGITLSDLVWKMKRAAVEAAKGCHDTKADAANALGISSQTLWNIERGNHK